jgi:hypothetical protein
MMFCATRSCSTQQDILYKLQNWANHSSLEPWLELSWGCAWRCDSQISKPRKTVNIWGYKLASM